MTKFDRESFNLLKMTDSGSESLPDLTFDLPADSKKKKKVRLKRKERKFRVEGSQLTELNSAWWNISTLTSSSCLIALVGAFGTIALIWISYFTSTLHYKIQMLETQLRLKIVDDDAKSVPETLVLIKIRLATLEANQTSVVEALDRVNRDINSIQARLDSVVRAGGDSQVRQSVAELGVKVGEIGKEAEVVMNRTGTNTEGIHMLNKELKNLKLNDIDLKTSVAIPKTSTTTLSDAVATRLDLFNSSFVLQGHRLDRINATLLGVEHNSTVMIDWVKQDVVTIQGKLSQLQDDNLNVSSKVDSLKDGSSVQLLSLKSQLDSIEAKIEAFEEKIVTSDNEDKSKKAASVSSVNPNPTLVAGLHKVKKKP